MLLRSFALRQLGGGFLHRWSCAERKSGRKGFAFSFFPRVSGTTVESTISFSRFANVSMFPIRTNSRPPLSSIRTYSSARSSSRAATVPPMSRRVSCPCTRQNQILAHRDKATSSLQTACMQQRRDKPAQKETLHEVASTITAVAQETARSSVVSGRKRSDSNPKLRVKGEFWTPESHDGSG